MVASPIRCSKASAGFKVAGIRHSAKQRVTRTLTQALPQGGGPVAHLDASSRLAIRDADALPEFVQTSGNHSPEQLVNKLWALAERQRCVLAMRVEPEMYAAARLRAPGIEYNARSKTLKLWSALADDLPKTKRFHGSVALIVSESADQVVSEEARVLTDYLGAYVFRIGEIAPGGIHKLLSQQDALRVADVVIAICGTDVALPSMLTGLTAAPVIAVPGAGTGAVLGGLTPLLAVLSSNANVMCVGIDNGCQAAVAAVRMLRMASRLHDVRSQAQAAQQAALTPAAAAPRPAS